MHIINWEIFWGEEEVICEPLFCNGNIKENNKPILIKNWLCLDMGYVWIDTYLPKKRIFLSYQVFMHKYNVSMDFLSFGGFIWLLRNIYKNRREYLESTKDYIRVRKKSLLFVFPKDYHYIKQHKKTILHLSDTNRMDYSTNRKTSTVVQHDVQVFTI